MSSVTSVLNAVVVNAAAGARDGRPPCTPDGRAPGRYPRTTRRSMPSAPRRSVTIATSGGVPSRKGMPQ